MLDAYSMVVMERCDAASFKVCDYWIPPATFTALAIHPNSTYVMVEKCIFVAAEDREVGARRRAAESPPRPLTLPPPPTPPGRPPGRRRPLQVPPGGPQGVLRLEGALAVQH